MTRCSLSVSLSLSLSGRSSEEEANFTLSSHPALNNTQNKTKIYTATHSKGSRESLHTQMIKQRMQLHKRNYIIKHSIIILNSFLYLAVKARQMCDKESLKRQRYKTYFSKGTKKESKVFQVNNSTISYTHCPSDLKWRYGWQSYRWCLFIFDSLPSHIKAIIWFWGTPWQISAPF